MACATRRRIAEARRDSAIMAAREGVSTGENPYVSGRADGRSRSRSVVERRLIAQTASCDRKSFPERMSEVVWPYA
ncbi:Hypothetical protein BN69_3661 [Methylocystis sp. SC2]|nr:Hypothetical protein BN69_3661 [Methylocystis sp. SC2]